MKEHYIKIVDEIKIKPLLDYYNEHEKNFIWNTKDNKGKQSGLQYALNQDPWLSATERVKIKSRYFFLINPYFKNSIFENIITKYKLFRTRLLWLHSQNCYSMHFDDTPRIHIPLTTNSDSFIIFKDGVVEHLEIGKIYWVNTCKIHTAMNGGETSRLHLVGCIR